MIQKQALQNQNIIQRVQKKLHVGFSYPKNIIIIGG